MKLDKVTRKQLYTGRAQWFLWPDTGDVPRVGHVYSLETGSATDTHFRVLKTTHLPDDRWRVQAQLEADPVRLLGKRAGYTDFPGRAMRNGAEPEPEAVDEVAQRRITDDAHRGERGAIEDLVASLERCADDLKQAAAANPASKSISRELWQVKGRLDAAKAKLRRQVAA